MFPFDPPENMRKPLVCDVFKGDEKETLGRKGLRTARVSLTTFASNLHLFHVSRIKYVTNLSALVLTLTFSKKKKKKNRSKFVLGILVMHQKIWWHLGSLQNVFLMNHSNRHLLFQSQ